jgi:hypothetical protein
MTADQYQAAIKSLAEELSRLAHTMEQLADEDDDERQAAEDMDLAYLFRLVPSLCSAHISVLGSLVMALLDLQEKEHDETHDRRAAQ